MKHHSVYLLGFRATGKSTIGPLLGKKLDWKFVEMDRELEKLAGKTIPELTKDGTTWQEFRSLEHRLLKSLLEKKNLVVSTGGGLAVSDVSIEKEKMTFGELNTKLLIDKKSFMVLLTADEKIIETRIRETEKKSNTMLRPILDSKRAAQVNIQIKNMEELQKKNYLIEQIVRDSLNLYKKRQKLYLSLTKNIVDTGLLSIEETVNKIISLL
ncbi:hypothetical protein A2866_00345 [Candidatus Roizmanbacteria bacterium RIFCSPHIGHO2_01_FULL_39_8]|uniref:Shikimate kinase n=1 Tax=Candidatus Roizmanbacteria bacterium RIFCSPHIGHO2_01_FULL_39_8 TaxID=1802033 RepID=A0A1F7GJ45_9BACT|nr:MAG: hypothetical protein A2866_00345 [Candidatus Roizmanbacteria bacterium RIFCSPHIGHO2_01_FULL_39_8]